MRRSIEVKELLKFAAMLYGVLICFGVAVGIILYWTVGLRADDIFDLVRRT